MDLTALTVSNLRKFFDAPSSCKGKSSTQATEVTYLQSFLEYVEFYTDDVKMKDQLDTMKKYLKMHKTILLMQSKLQTTEAKFNAFTTGELKTPYQCTVVLRKGKDRVV